MSWAAHFALHCALAAGAYCVLAASDSEDGPTAGVIAAVIVMIVTGGLWL